MNAFVNGILRFGKHKGTHYSQLPHSYVSWASDNMKGFRSSLEAARAEKPRRKAQGRRYTLHSVKRKYIP